MDTVDRALALLLIFEVFVMLLFYVRHSERYELARGLYQRAQ